jgi:hypothetical protein
MTVATVVDLRPRRRGCHVSELTSLVQQMFELDSVVHEHDPLGT